MKRLRYSPPRKPTSLKQWKRIAAKAIKDADTTRRAAEVLEARVAQAEDRLRSICSTSVRTDERGVVQARIRLDHTFQYRDLGGVLHDAVISLLRQLIEGAPHLVVGPHKKLLEAARTLPANEAAERVWRLYHHLLESTEISHPVHRVLMRFDSHDLLLLLTHAAENTHLLEGKPYPVTPWPSS